MEYDVIIIGSGPAGYVAAIRAGQVGLKTLIVEKNDIGGMCLNYGCIPSKSMLESAKLYRKIANDASKFGIEGIDKKALSFNYSKAIKRSKIIVTKLNKGIEYLLNKNAVEIIKGEASIVSNNSVKIDSRLISAKNILISTGSVFPTLASKKEGLLVGIKEMFTDREIPENIVILGSNSIAVELAQFFNLIDKKVTILNPIDKILPLSDSYLANNMLASLKKMGINVINNTNIDDIDKFYKDASLILKEESIKCDMIINSLNRTARVPKSEIAIELENGFIKTDENCRTSIPSIYAIGDVNGKSQFAHASSAQGLHVINHIKGIKNKLDLKKFPLNMYTVPEYAQIGETEDSLKERKADYKVNEFSLTANGKAMAEGESEGFIRILSDNKYGEVLGVQIVASHATDMIAEAAAYMQVESTIYDIAETVHAHPTISEIFMEAGMDASFKAIHK